MLGWLLWAAIFHCILSLVCGKHLVNSSAVQSAEGVAGAKSEATSKSKSPLLAKRAEIWDCSTAAPLRSLRRNVALRLRPLLRSTRDPSLRLKSAWAQDDSDVGAVAMRRPGDKRRRPRDRRDDHQLQSRQCDRKAAPPVRPVCLPHSKFFCTDACSVLSWGPPKKVAARYSGPVRRSTQPSLNQDIRSTLENR
jgi:hypothetical protein